MWGKKLGKIFRSSIIVILIASLGVNYPAFAQTTNHGLAVLDFEISGNNVAFIVDELEQGVTDLNGDGDQADTVLHTLVLGGSPINHGLAVDFFDFFIDGNNVVFAVNEASQNADLNGDSDIADFVLHTLVLGGSPINHGLAIDPSSFFIDGNNVVFEVDEAEQGLTDLNGDSDQADFVLHTLVFGGSPTNIGLAGTGDPFVSGNNVAFTVDESEQGLTDLNGDSDMADFVLHTLVFGGSPINHGLAVPPFNLSVDGNNVVFVVDELEQGVTDLNGDSDMADDVLHTLVFGGSPINHGLAATGDFFVLGNNVVFRVDELEQGVTDFNGDGDMADFVLHTLVFGGSPTNIGLAVPFFDFFMDGNNVVFEVDEASQTADLNGDSDIADFVLHTLVIGGSPINHGLASSVPAISGNNVVFAVNEASQTADLNGDSDIADFVLHTLVLGGSTTNHQLAIGGFPIIDGNNVAFLVHEPSENADFNGDSDQADFVIHSLIFGGSPTNHQLAIGSFQLIDGNNVAFLVRELDQTADLNGDSDIADFVLHTLVITPPSGCAIQTTPNVDTIISSNCTITTTVIAGGSVTVESPAVVTVTSTGTLDIDFTTKNLTVNSGAGVLIESGGSIT